MLIDSSFQYVIFNGKCSFEYMIDTNRIALHIVHCNTWMSQQVRKWLVSGL